MIIIRVVFLLLSIALAVLPWLPAPIAGNLILISLAGIPIFLIDIILLLTIRKKHRHRHHRRHHHHHRAWYKKLNCWRIAFIVVIIALFPMLRGYLPLWGTQPTPNTKHPTPLTIVSWNADKFSLSSKTLHASSMIIDEFQPDIICIQERPHDTLMPWDSIKAAFPNHPYTIKNTREDEILNLAVLSKYPISNLREYYYPKSFNKALRVDLQVEERQIRLFNIHLETTSMGTKDIEDSTPDAVKMINKSVSRNQQAVELFEAVDRSTSPVILCGDFNDTRCGYPYRLFTTKLTDLSRIKPFSSSYQGYGNLLKIDYILYSKGFTPSTYQLIENEWSDHKIQVGKLYF